MALTETLRLLIDADTRGAVSGVEKLGTTTERELSKSKASLDKWGSGLTTAGAGMIGLGSAALFGLGKAAQASEEANLAVVKLQNSIKNSPALVGESSGQFIKLADSIQDVTAADADQIVAGEAMLATFRLTADQIKGITPLVVDYARKFGVDMVTAATQVGKALDGNVTALKKNGVSIDEAAFAANHYTAVQQALASQVGGFAEEEGKTFAGSLERMKNELGDLAEGVGGGAVDAFTTLFGVVDDVAGALESISPGAQNAIGKIATFSSVGLIAAGSLSVVIGQVTKARQNFEAFGSGLSTLVGKVGGFRNALVSLGEIGAVIAALAALRGILGTIGDDVDRVNLGTLEGQLLDLAETGSAAGSTLKRVFDLDVSTPEKWSQAAADLDQLDKALASLSTKDPEGAAKAFKEISAALKDQGASASQVKDNFNDYLSTVADADVTNRTAKEGIDGTAGAFGEEADAATEAKDALQEYHDKLQALLDPLFGLQDSLANNAEAQANVTAKTMEVAAAQAEYDEALRAHGPDSDAARDASMRLMEAQAQLTDANHDAVRSAQDVDGAIADMRAEIEQNPAALDQAKAKLAQWVTQGFITQQQADATGVEFDQLAQKIGATPDAKTVAVGTAGINEAKVNLQSVKDAVDGVPAFKSVHVNVTATGTAALNLISNKLLGFAVGGVVPGPVGRPQLAVVHGGEEVVPWHDAAAMAKYQPMVAPPQSGWGGGGSQPVTEVTNIVLDGRVVARSVRRRDRWNPSAA